MGCQVSYFCWFHWAAQVEKPVESEIAKVLMHFDDEGFVELYPRWRA